MMEESVKMALCRLSLMLECAIALVKVALKREISEEFLDRRLKAAKALMELSLGLEECGSQVAMLISACAGVLE